MAIAALWLLPVALVIVGLSKKTQNYFTLLPGKRKMKNSMCLRDHLHRVFSFPAICRLVFSALRGGGTCWAIPKKLIIMGHSVVQ